MADLKVCDQCGKRIDVFKGIKTFITPVWYRFSTVEGSCVCFELCSECNKEFVEFIRNDKEADSDVYR